MTSYEVIYESFFNRIVNDTDFFSYVNISDDLALEIAKSRSKTYLKGSIAYLLLKSNPDIDFTDRDDKTEEFNFKLSEIEIKLLTELMFREYMALEQVNLKVNEAWFSDRDLKVMGSSHLERSTFNNFFNSITFECDKLIKSYTSRDRVTGKRKIISFEGL